MGRIFKRDDHWWIDYTNGRGQRRREKASREKGMAMRMLAKEELLALRQRAGEIPLDMTEDLAEIMAKYRAHLQNIRRRPNTIDTLERSFRNVIGFLGWKTIDQVRRPAVEEWVAKRHTWNGENGTRAQTLNHYTQMLMAMFKWAVENGLILSNPLAGLFPLPNDPSRFRRDLKREEIERILAAVESDEWRLRFAVFFNTALRSTAGGALRWEWIRWESREIVLPANLNKSKKDHRIPMNAALHQALLAYRAANPVREDGHVFKPMTSRHVLRRLKEFCEAAGVDVDGVCTHSTRHTVATLIYEATGHDLKAAQDVLGHASIATTGKYLHADEASKRRGVDALDFGTNVAPRPTRKPASA